MIVNDLIQIVLITLTPLLESRASIPYGILVLDVHWIFVFLVAALSNIFLAYMTYTFLDKFIEFAIRFKMLKTFYTKHALKVQNKIKTYVEKYGEFGVAVFIGIPIPGSGVCSAALGSHVLGMGINKFMKAAIAGVLISATIITSITVIFL